MVPTGKDDELTAIEQLISALEPLDQQARRRVISYVFQRLGLEYSTDTSLEQVEQHANRIPAVAEKEYPTVQDIRTLTAEKAPKSGPERVALVAYYLQEMAPSNERKSNITAADLKKYLKQAALPLPPRASQALVNAKNAGYIDSSGHGKYALNAVGHNLIVHGLPTARGKSSSSTKSRAKRGARKKTANITKRRTVARKKATAKRPRPKRKRAQLK